ncbi:hypothetical protein QL285_027432 [Trifolium repens]|nr:hypothetical protein QL285_027432 [Trifolium repens]
MSSFSYADLVKLLTPSTLLKYAIGLLSCINIAPTPLPGASNSITKSLEKSGKAKTGVVVSLLFNSSKAVWASIPHLKPSFLVSSVNGLAILP